MPPSTDSREFIIPKKIPPKRLTDSAPPRQAMVHKWYFRYSEPNVTAQWEKIWGGHLLTHVSVNQFNPNRGGFPADNNALELLNNIDKESLKCLQMGAVMFIGECYRLTN
jgi:hypothetical protein